VRGEYKDIQYAYLVLAQWQKRSVSLEGSSTGVMSVSPSGWSPVNTIKAS